MAAIRKILTLSFLGILISSCCFATPKALRDISATYGTESTFINVSEKIKSMRSPSNKTLDIPAQSYNTLFGDPVPGQKKRLTIKFRVLPAGPFTTKIYEEDSAIYINAYQY